MLLTWSQSLAHHGETAKADPANKILPSTHLRCGCQQFCKTPRDKGQMACHLKCLCTSPCRQGNKREKTELHLQSHHYNAIGITETQWESSCDGSPAVVRHRPSGKTERAEGDEGLCSLQKSSLSAQCVICRVPLGQNQKDHQWQRPHSRHLLQTTGPHRSGWSLLQIPPTGLRPTGLPSHRDFNSPGKSTQQHRPQ